MPGQNVSGRVINVTAWKDEYKDGGHYVVYISECGKPGSDLQLRSLQSRVSDQNMGILQSKLSKGRPSWLYLGAAEKHVGSTQPS